MSTNAWQVNYDYEKHTNNQARALYPANFPIHKIIEIIRISAFY